MDLDMLKLKRLCEGKKTRNAVSRTTLARRNTKRLTTDEKGRQIYVDQSVGGGKAEDVEDDDETLAEGKKYRTPEFVRHCVAAIVERPKDLARIESQAPEGSDGSPFAICHAKYNENKRSLAAKHSRGDHHSTADYEKALAKLREDTEALRRQNEDRSEVCYSDAPPLPATRETRHLVRFIPKG